jgi:hypothetical protein
MQHFTPVSAFFGGLLISLGEFVSRIAGINGIVGGKVLNLVIMRFSHPPQRVVLLAVLW